LSAWKVIGYTFLGCGTVFLIVAAFVFFRVMATISQVPFIGQELSPVALAPCVPYLILAAIAYVIGGVSYCAGRVNPATPLISSNEAELMSDTILDTLKRLKGIDDDNFNVINRSLDEIKENS